MKPTKKKAIRIERAKQRVMSKGKTEQEAIEMLKAKKRMPKVKALEEFLNECDKSNSAHKLEVGIDLSPSNYSITRLHYSYDIL